MFTIRKKVFVGVGLAAAMLLGWTVPASAETSGIANFDGFLVVSGESGTREVLKTEISVSGAFEGVGTIEETENHLRGLGPHVRGCWPVDLILSKDR